MTALSALWDRKPKPAGVLCRRGAEPERDRQSSEVRPAPPQPQQGAASTERTLAQLRGILRQNEETDTKPSCLRYSETTGACSTESRRASGEAGLPGRDGGQTRPAAGRGLRARGPQADVRGCPRCAGYRAQHLPPASLVLRSDPSLFLSRYLLDLLFYLFVTLTA